jgi:hypothetical protein
MVYFHIISSSSSNKAVIYLLTLISQYNTVSVVGEWNMSMERGGRVLTGKTEILRKPCLSVTLCTSIATWVPAAAAVVVVVATAAAATIITKMRF